VFYSNTSDGTVNVSEPSVTWNISQVAAGETDWLDLYVSFAGDNSIQTGTLVCNEATVYGSGDVHPNNNTDADTGTNVA